MKIKLLVIVTILLAAIGGTVIAFEDCYGGPGHWAETYSCDGYVGRCITNKKPCPE